MKIGILSDTHYGARKGSKLFHDYFEEFYKNTFFPTLDEQGIDTVVHMGDAFDSRKGIEFKSLDWAKRVVFNPLKQRGIQVHLMVGNHDAYYKNTNEINAINLLLKEYDNVKVYSSATEVELGNLKTLFIPWINEQNQNQTEKLIQKTSCKCAMGHLELQGFRINKQITMDHGMESKLFDKFTKVFSGHYHTRSDNGRIFYLGNPYEIYWTDVNDLRGFTIFDTETLEHYPVNNPYRIFYNIYYEDQDYQIFDTSEYKNKIVKLIVRKKSDIKKFEKFVDKLYSSGIADLKVVENFDFSSLTEEQSEVFESEDTLSILDRYIQETDTELDKSNIQSIIREIYQEACELG
jgi:DNA repair exonuclease SbcCD nuclease subunit